MMKKKLEPVHGKGLKRGCTKVVVLLRTRRLGSISRQREQTPARKQGIYTRNLDFDLVYYLLHFSKHNCYDCTTTFSPSYSCPTTCDGVPQTGLSAQTHGLESFTFSNTQRHEHPDNIY